MKPSRFNFVFPHEGQHVVYNTFSKAIALLDDGELAALRAGGEGEGALAEQFRDQGFWVEDSFDELAFLKYYHYKAKFSAEQLSLTIAPTLGCNFACPYCYENARTGVMSEGTQDALLSYVEGKLRTGTRSLDITWYGGEPLLCTEVVERMSAALRELAARYGAVLGMSLVTNGYLLTREPADYTVGEILRVLEGNLAPVSCADGTDCCGRADRCVTVEVWREIQQAVAGVVDHITLADLVQRQHKKAAQGD